MISNIFEFNSESLNETIVFPISINYLILRTAESAFAWNSSFFKISYKFLSICEHQSTLSIKFALKEITFIWLPIWAQGNIEISVVIIFLEILCKRVKEFSFSMVSVVCPLTLVDHLKIITHESTIAVSLIVEDKSIVARPIGVFQNSLMRLRTLWDWILKIWDSCHLVDFLFPYIFILLNGDIISLW